MNIFGINPNSAEIGNVSHKPATSTNNHAGPSFAESFRDIARSANIQIAGGNNAASLQLTRRKEESLEELFSYTKAEEELAENYLAKIKKLLKEFTDKK